METKIYSLRKKVHDALLDAPYTYDAKIRECKIGDSVLLYGSVYDLFTTKVSNNRLDQYIESIKSYQLATSISEGNPLKGKIIDKYPINKTSNGTPMYEIKIRVYGLLPKGEALLSLMVLLYCLAKMYTIGFIVLAIENKVELQQKSRQ